MNLGFKGCFYQFVESSEIIEDNINKFTVFKVYFILKIILVLNDFSSLNPFVFLSLRHAASNMDLSSILNKLHNLLIAKLNNVVEV